MKVFAQYDSKGAIRALITAEAREGTMAMPTPPPGLFMAEVEDVKLDSAQIKSGTAEVVRTLREIAERHEVDVSMPRCTLKKKE
jgi:hypothetical protein